MSDRTLLAETVAKKTMRLKSFSSLKKQIAAYLLEHNMTSELDLFIRDVMAYRAERGLIEATAVSAYPISAAVRKDIMSELKKEFPDALDIVLNEKVDESVVGGVRIETVNSQLDLSVRARLNKLKRLTAARNA